MDVGKHRQLSYRHATLSDCEIRRDVTRGRLRISGELPLHARVVYGIAAKHARCMVTCLKCAIYRV